MSAGYLGLKETMKFLDVNKTDLEKLVRNRRLTAYKLGGSHLRFKKDQVLILKHEMETVLQPAKSGGGTQKITQFWSFNGFYIVTGALLSGLLIYLLNS